MKIVKYGDRSVLIKWEDLVNEEILNELILLKEHLRNNYPEVEISSAYNSILISSPYGSKAIKKEEVLAQYQKIDFSIKTKVKKHRIPVCYHDEFAVDLEPMSSIIGMEKEEIIKRHHSASYIVYFNGFLPGFMYLGGLDESIAIARKNSPSMDVKSGSVAIGGNQTGIYPQASPGGWHVIGRTPIDVFNPKSESPCIAKAGDLIEFYPIEKEEYFKIKEAIK